MRDIDSIFIANTKKIWDQKENLEMAIEKSFPNGRLVYTGDKDEAIDVCKFYDGVSTIVAIGGDGTVNAALQGLMKQKTPASLGIIPAGSGNDIARLLNILKFSSNNSLEEFQKNYDFLQQDTHKAIDIGYFQTPNQNNFFLSYVGAGLFAQVTRKANHQKKKRYVQTFLQQLTCEKKKKNKITLLDDDISRNEKMLSVEIMNNNYFGKGIQYNSQGNWNDGLVEMYLLKELAFSRLIPSAIQLLRKKHHKQREIQYGQIKDKISLEFDQPALIHYDGETGLYKTKKIDVKIIPRALNIKYPN